MLLQTAMSKHVCMDN